MATGYWSGNVNSCSDHITVSQNLNQGVIVAAKASFRVMTELTLDSKVSKDF